MAVTGGQSLGGPLTGMGILTRFRRPGTASLYAKIGGHDDLVVIVEDFYCRVFSTTITWPVFMWARLSGGLGGDAEGGTAPAP